MKNIKQKIIATLILIIVIGVLAWVTIYLKNKNTDTLDTEKKGITLFTKKDPGQRQVKEQGVTGNESGDFTGNDTTKPVSIIENVINTITGNNNSSNNAQNNASINPESTGKGILGFLLGRDGLPQSSEVNQDVAVNKNTENKIPEIVTTVDTTEVFNPEIENPECSPAVYVSKYTQWQDLKLQLQLGIKTQASLSDVEKELQAWKPTAVEIDQDNMKRVLHRYWDIWSYPDNYLTQTNTGECGTWTDTSGEANSDFFKLTASQIVVNKETINNAKREVRKSFSALSTIISSDFSVNQSEGQRLIAQNDNIRYDSLLNDCRVIRGQFEGGFTYARDGKTRIDIPQYYKPGSQLGIPTERGNETARTDTEITNAQKILGNTAPTHSNIARDLSRRVLLQPLGVEKSYISSEEVFRNQELSLKERFQGSSALTTAEKQELEKLRAKIKRENETISRNKESLAHLIRSEIIKSELANWNDQVSILTMTDIGNISYLWDKNNPWTGDITIFPKNKAENINNLPGRAAGVVNNNNIRVPAVDFKNHVRFFLTDYPKIQYGGKAGTAQLRGDTFWSNGHDARNFLPGVYLISEPQSIWDVLQQDNQKVLFCRVNRFMAMWAGIETNSEPTPYINTHGINCDNSTKVTEIFNSNQAGGGGNIWDGIPIVGPGINIAGSVGGVVLDGAGFAVDKIGSALDTITLGAFSAVGDFIGGIFGGNSGPPPSNVPRFGYEGLDFSNPLAYLERYSYIRIGEKDMMKQFYGIERDNWYSNNVQNMIYEFIKDED